VLLAKLRAKLKGPGVARKTQGKTQGKVFLTKFMAKLKDNFFLTKFMAKLQGKVLLTTLNFPVAKLLAEPQDTWYILKTAIF